MTGFAHIREFKAAVGAGFNDKDAQRIGTFLEEAAGLGEGPVGAETIVGLARPKRSPIHKEFEWDDAKAGHQHRLSQARHLVRHVVVVTELDGAPVETRAFHHITMTKEGGGQRGYISERVVWHEPEMAEQVVAKAFQELRAWRDRYTQYDQLGAAITKVDEALVLT